MNLNYIFGVSRSGKSRYIYQQIKNDLNNTDKNLILIVPEQITYEKERELIDFLETNGIMRVQILSFTRLQYKVLEEVGGIKEKEINNYGKIMLLREIFQNERDNLKVFGRSYKKEGFLKNFNLLLKELKENRVQLEFLEKLEDKEFENYGFDRKLEDIKIIYKNLEEKLKNTFLDNEDKKDLFIKKIKNSKYINNSIIYIDEFNKFSSLQIQMIRELLLTSKEIYLTLPLEKKDSLKEIEREEFRICVNTLNDLNKKLEGLNPKIVTIWLKRRKILKDDINHLERNFFDYFPQKYKSLPENIEIFYGQNPYEEIEILADKIIKDLRKYNYRYKDIGILLGDESVYIPVIEKVFKEYDIPFFTDYKKDLMYNSFIVFLMSYLDCIAYNYKREDIFRLLKVGYWDFDYDDIETIENYSLRWGIDRNRWFEEFKYKDEEDNLEFLNNLREKIIEILPSKKLYTGKNTIEKLVNTICSDIDNLNIKEKIEKDTEILRDKNLFEEAYVNNQIWNSVMDLFDQIITISGDSKINIIELKNILDSGLEEYKVGVIPPKIDSVTIGNLDRTKFGSKEAIYLVGVNDGYMPKNFDDNGILIDEEKDLLKKKGLELKDSEYEIDSGKHNFYNILSRGKEKISFSYSLGDYDGSSLIRSSYIDKIIEIFPKIIIRSSLISTHKENLHVRINPVLNQAVNVITKENTIEDLDDIYKETLKWLLLNKKNFNDFIKKGLLYTNNKKNIDEIYIKELYENPLTLSPYGLESFSNCPFKFFVEYGLKPVERKEYVVDNRDIGKIYHSSVEKFTKHIADNKEEFIDLEDGLKIMKNSIEDAINEEKDKNSPIDYTYRNKYLKKKITRVGMETAKGLIEHLNRSDFKPSYYEISFEDNSKFKSIEKELSKGEKLRIKGRIDRVDIYESDNGNFVNIIDYKSKDKSIDLTSLVNGMELQLFIYLDALIKNSERITGNNSMIGGVFYFSILLPWINGDEFSDEKEIEKQLLKSYKMEGFFLEDKELIKKLDKKIEEERESTLARIKFNKNGSISKNSQTLDKESFEGLLNFVDNKVKEIGEDILRGKIIIEPYKKNKEIPCNWCSYIDICQFDKTMPDNNYRIISKVDKKDFEELIKKVGDSDD